MAPHAYAHRHASAECSSLRDEAQCGVFEIFFNTFVRDALSLAQHACCVYATCLLANVQRLLEALANVQCKVRDYKDWLQL